MVETRKILRQAALALTLLSVCVRAFAQDETDLSSISLESLMNVKVSSVSRHLEELRGSAAAVYVITQEDIRRSGMSDLADLFRMVPGMNVAQSNSSTWAISARGFNAQYATKLLVLVDGRTVYDPGFSGVWWHMQNLVLEDIERIEVIRGPGATLWGANAVNGVINITTKRPADTQGGLFVADFGSSRPGEGSFRFGGALGGRTTYKLYGRQTTRMDSSTSTGTDGGDAWNFTNSGVRLDFEASTSNSFTFETEVHRGVRGSRQEIVTSLTPLTFQQIGLMSNQGGHALARWKHAFNEESNLALQFYVDKKHYGGYGAQHQQTVDFELQHTFRLGKRQVLTWGFDRRQVTDDFPETLAFGMTPSSADTRLTSAFVQDEMTFLAEKLRFTIGSKFEHSSIAGYNTEPSVRLAWVPTARHSLWVATAHAVHTASRTERGMHANVGSFQAGPTFGLVELLGQESSRSEGLMAYETGYRYQANRRLWTLFSAYVNVYDHLSALAAGEPLFVTNPLPPHLVLPIYFDNRMKGKTYGIETAASYKATDFWTLRGSYSFLQMHLRAPAGDTSAQDNEGQSPKHQVYVSSFVTLPKSLELSGHAYFVSALRFFDVPSYTRVDANLTWKGFEKVELSLIGQNLQGSHMEFGQNPSPANRVHRSVYGKMAWRF